jgi:hypothetical protein
MTTTEKTAVHSAAKKALIYKTDKIHGKDHIFVTISLDDDGKNGYQDFSITADIYEAGKRKIEKYLHSCGCCHGEILKAFPEFKIFVQLHLSDWEGVPMYAVENGFYHLKNGFNRTAVTAPEFMIEFCKYYRITELQYITLSESRNELQYALNLESLGILKQWKKQAKKAIEILEGLTNKTFLVDSPKSQYKRPTAEEVIQEQEREKAGYYTPEAEEGRKQAKKQAIIEQMKATANKKINEITEELSIMLQVFEIGGEKAANNCIFYTHTKTLAFNWKSYNMIPESEVNKIMSELKLPEGVKVINKYGK